MTILHADGNRMTGRRPARTDTSICRVANESVMETTEQRSR